jgi:hypothetical protein
MGRINCHTCRIWYWEARDCANGFQLTKHVRHHTFLHFSFQGQLKPKQLGHHKQGAETPYKISRKAAGNMRLGREGGRGRERTHKQKSLTLRRAIQNGEEEAA